MFLRFTSLKPFCSWNVNYFQALCTYRLCSYKKMCSIGLSVIANIWYRKLCYTVLFKEGGSFVNARECQNISQAVFLSENDLKESWIVLKKKNTSKNSHEFGDLLKNCCSSDNWTLAQRRKFPWLPWKGMFCFCISTKVT